MVYPMVFPNNILIVFKIIKIRKDKKESLKKIIPPGPREGEEEEGVNNWILWLVDAKLLPLLSVREEKGKGRKEKRIMKREWEKWEKQGKRGKLWKRENRENRENRANRQNRENRETEKKKKRSQRKERIPKATGVDLARMRGGAEGEGWERGGGDG